MRFPFADNLRHIQRKSLIGQIVVVALGVNILFLSTFISLSLPTATYHNLRSYACKLIVKINRHLPEKAQDILATRLPFLIEENEPVHQLTVRYSSYVPTSPIAIVVAYVLGIPLAVVATLAYFLLGLLGPIAGIYAFSEGGGLQYYSQPGFGYLIGIIFSSLAVAWITAGTRNSLRQTLSVIGGIFLVHIIGAGYLFGSSFLILIFKSEAAYLTWQPWLLSQVRNLTWYQLPYDLLFSLVLIGLAFPVRWLIDVLTAPDISARAKAGWKKVAKEVL